MRQKAEKALGEILASGIDVHRCAAARALGQADTPGARAALRAALLDEDPDVRVDAAAALALHPDPEVAPALMENLLGDPEADVKAAAIRALVAIGDPAVVPLLRRLCVSRTEEIFWDEDEFYQEGWDSWVDIQLLAIQSLGQLGDRDAVPMILEAIADEEGQDLFPVATRALVAMGGEGAAALDDLARTARVLDRQRIAEAIGAAPGPQARALQGRLLADPEPAVRIAMLAGLTPDDERLAGLFDDPDPEVRAAVLAHAGAAHVDQTAAAMGDPIPEVRIAAFDVVAANPGLFRAKEHLQAVRDGIAEDPKAASAAAMAWVALKGENGIRGFRHVMERPDLPLEYRLGVVRALRRAGPGAAPLLAPGARDDDRQLRLATMTALAELAGEDPAWPNPAADTLLAALRGTLIEPPEEPDEVEAEEVTPDLPPEDAAEIRAQEAEIDDSLPLVVEEGSTLDAILNPAPVPMARNMVTEDPDLDPALAHRLEVSKRSRFGKNKVSLDVKVAPWQDVRRFAANVLGKVARPEVAEALFQALDDDDPEVVTAALTSLADLGAAGVLDEDALGPLAETLATGSDAARKLAARVLGHVPGQEAEQWLTTLLDDEQDFVRLEAVLGLEQRGLAPDAFRALLDDSYPGIAIAAARALASHRGRESIDDLVRFACQRDGTYRADIGRWLAAAAPDAGIAGFVALLADEDQKRNWLVAIDALAELLAGTRRPDGDRPKLAA